MSKKRRSEERSQFRLPESADPRRGGSPRKVQVGDAVRQALAELISEGALKDPRISQAMVTITDVEMTPDLKLARVYFSVFPDAPETVAAVWKGLRSATGEMKRHLGARLQLRFTPEVELRLDPSVAEGAKIETILREIRDEERESGE